MTNRSATFVAGGLGILALLAAPLHGQQGGGAAAKYTLKATPKTVAWGITTRRRCRCCASSRATRFRLRRSNSPKRLEDARVPPDPLQRSTSMTREA